MGAGVAPVLVGANGDVLSTGQGITGLDQDTWRRVECRLDDYLKTLGLQDPVGLERVRARVRLRVESRAVTGALENPIEAAIEEAHILLDRWLADELGIEGDANLLCAARAAVLSGAVPGWTARWAGLSDMSPAAAIRAACIAPVPDYAPLTMESGTIDLCCHRLVRRLFARVRRLLGISRKRAGGHV
jgi:hypothetical protein